MNKVINLGTLSWFWMALALVLIVLVIGAGSFGIDSDQKWGPFRIGILLISILSLFIPLMWKVAGAVDSRIESLKVASNHASNPVPIGSSVSNGADLKLALMSSGRKWLTILITFVLVELMYVWIVSTGHMTVWPQTTEYYNLLADAFINGQTALMIEPSPLLSELDNPYDADQRRGIPIPLWDMSYFDGQYYLYWGPAPALFIAVWKLVTGLSVGDQHIVFIAVSVVFTFSVLIIFNWRRKYYPNMPHWLLIASLVIVATAHPLMWVLNFPSIHRAAIASAQAFLLVGLYIALPVMDGSSKQLWRLAGAGFLWILAFSTRATLIGPVGLLATYTLIAALAVKTNRRDLSSVAKKLSAIGLPFIAGLAAVGTYNYSRFGNFLEIGFRYQIAGLENSALISKDQLFNLGYLIPNALHYWIAPLQTRATFPFIRPNFGESMAIPSLFSRLTIPGAYKVHDYVGLLFAVPAIIFAGYLVVVVLGGRRVLKPVEFTSGSVEFEGRPYFPLRYILGVVLTSGILAAVPFMLYFWVADRFLLDAVPLLALVAAGGAWFLYQAGHSTPVRRAYSTVLVVGFTAATALIGFLLAFTGAGSRFDDLNPEMYNRIIELFSP